MRIFCEFFANLSQIFHEFFAYFSQIFRVFFAKFLRFFCARPREESVRYILLKFAFIFRVPLKMSFFKYFVLGGIEMRTNEWNLLNYDLWVIQNAFAFCVVGSIFEVYNTTSNSIKNKLPKTRLRQLLGSAFIFCLSVCAICLLICQIYHNLHDPTITYFGQARKTT